MGSSKKQKKSGLSHKPVTPPPLVHLGLFLSLLAKKVGFSRSKTIATKISHKVQDNPLIQDLSLKFYQFVLLLNVACLRTLHNTFCSYLAPVLVIVIKLHTSYLLTILYYRAASNAITRVFCLKKKLEGEIFAMRLFSTGIDRLQIEVRWQIKRPTCLSAIHIYSNSCLDTFCVFG